MKKKHAIIAAAVLVVLAVPGGTVYYHYESGAACARCHEIRTSYNDWHSSTHRKVACSKCHGSALTFDLGFHLTNLRRVVAHFRGIESGTIKMTHRDLFPIAERCQSCHREEFAEWQSGPHATTFAQIFLDKKHNTERKLTDDCLRCHGMHFAGGIRDLVTPVDSQGPWKLAQPELSGRPAIPCLTCHEIHREGRPLEARMQRVAAVGSKQETVRPSVSLYDRREQAHFQVGLLPLPVVHDGDHLVRASTDQRQALCYQCHAPLAGAQAGSGDDRTPVGVHEGVSCLGCHGKHNQQTRQSCASCHPRMSNCGIDVEKMDTTFKDPNSKHDIHFVKCEDCHPKGVPPRRNALRALAED